MTVLLSAPYGNFASGSIVEFPASTETALIAQGLATTSASNPTSGAYTTNQSQGTATIAIGASSVVITCSLVTASSKISAYVAQTAADGTLLRVERVVAAAGSFTIFGTANATAATVIDWAIIPAFGIPAQ